MAVQNDFPCQLIHVLFDLVVLNHNDHKTNYIQERTQVMILICYNILLNERMFLFSPSVYRTIKNLCYIIKL